MKTLAKTLILLCSTMVGQAQSSSNASGGDATGVGGSAAYSVGQVVYTTSNGTTGSVAQGVQQPYEVSLVTVLEEAQDIHFTAVVYPNPSRDLFELKVDHFNTDQLTTKLFSIDGKLLKQQNVNQAHTTLDLSALTPACYFLHVVQSEKTIKTFKIIKN